MTMPGFAVTAGRFGKGRDTADGLLHRHFPIWITAAGGQKIFLLPTTVTRIEDVLVFANGALKTPDQSGTNHDYGVRGLTPGLPGDANAVIFHAAPGAGVVVALLSLGG